MVWGSVPLWIFMLEPLLPRWWFYDMEPSWMVVVNTMWKRFRKDGFCFPLSEDRAWRSTLNHNNSSYQTLNVPLPSFLTSQLPEMCLLSWTDYNNLLLQLKTSRTCDNIKISNWKEPVPWYLMFLELVIGTQKSAWSNSLRCIYGQHVSSWLLMFLFKL